MPTRDICRQMTIRVEDDELFVGNKTRYKFGSECVGWISRKNIEKTWTLEEDGFWHNPAEEDLRLILSQDDIDKVREITPILRDNTPGNVSDSWQRTAQRISLSLRRLITMSKGPGLCGSVRPLIPAGKIITVGYGAIRIRRRNYRRAKKCHGRRYSKFLLPNPSP